MNAWFTNNIGKINEKQCCRPHFNKEVPTLVLVKNLDIKYLILNNEFVGLYGHGNSNVINGNLVINNSNTASLGVEGGSYELVHVSFANTNTDGALVQLRLLSKRCSAYQSHFQLYLYGRAMNVIHFNNQEARQSQLANMLLELMYLVNC